MAEKFDPATLPDLVIGNALRPWGNAMYQGYGQTELLPIAMMRPRQWFAKDVRGCVMPLAFAQLQIWNEDNNPVPSGEAGEIVAKCDAQMRGDHRRIVDGRVKTGKIGRLDAEATTTCSTAPKTW
jgi:acyl-CoA synthetase (AMP-forming)/AMP-acid ligase II